MSVVKTLEFLRYCKGRIYWSESGSASADAGSAPALPVSLLRYERGELLLNAEGPEMEVPEKQPAFVDLQTDKALYHISCKVIGTTSTATHRRVLRVTVEDIDVIQRRRDRRFPVKVFTLIRPVTEEEWRKRRGLSTKDLHTENADGTSEDAAAEADQDAVEANGVNGVQESAGDPDAKADATEPDAAQAEDDAVGDEDRASDDSEQADGSKQDDQDFDIMSGTTLDVSRGGLRFMSDVPLKEGSRVELRLQLSGEPLRVEGRVVRRREAQGGTAFYGVKFTSLGLVDERRLAKFVLQKERRERQLEQATNDKKQQAAARGAAPATAARRDTRPRWQQRGEGRRRR